MRACVIARIASATAIGALVVACGGSTETAPATVGIPLIFCASSGPIWMAYQDDAGAWTRSIPDGSGLYHAAINSRGGIATVSRSNATGAFTLYVEYASAAELTAEYSSCKRSTATGTKVYQGSVAGLGTSDAAQITMGGVASTAFANFNMSGVADGPLDLVATRLSTSNPRIFGPPTAIIVRRGVNLASGAVMPLLDFSSAEAFAPSSNTVTIANLDSAYVSVAFLTATKTYAGLFEDTIGASATRAYFGVPAAQLVAGDLHDVLLVAGSNQSARFFESFSHTLTDQTLTLGSELASPTITLVDTSTNIRPRIQATVQPEYHSLFQVDYVQSGLVNAGNTVTVLATAAYIGAGATAWDLTIPDLKKVDGFSATWGLQPGEATQWDAESIGGVTVDQLSATPYDGLAIAYAARIGAVSSQTVVAPRPPQRAANARLLVLDVQRPRAQREHLARRE